MSDGVLEQIEDRVNDDIYCVYTDYESDHNGAYTTIVGCKVNDIENVPEGLTSLSVASASYIKYTAKGKLPDAVAQTWQYIWNSTIDRAYVADFDVYSAKAWN
jgi:predicted transcriptional regulator YdeE